MAVTILNRPEGGILGSAQTGAVTDFAGVVVVTSNGHGLIEDDLVYVESDIENYNGFFYVGFSSVNQFLLKDYPDAPTGISYIVDETITFYKSSIIHGWSCVHLPITYRLSTDLYPTNSADTTRTINSVQNANGYTVILLSGSLGSGVNSYDFVKIEAPSDTELSKVYQIVEFISPTVMIINLEYDSGNNFTGATALKHYNNYNIIVRVYAGINASHTWAAQKPYELAATIPYIPDDNNEAFFSINEILKSYIETRNNLILGTLPNNIDFWTNFYIEIAESYDDSDGYAFGTFTSNYTSDQSTFEGTAVNAKLEFKNIHSGYLSEYLMTNNTAKFLTLFTIPVLFSCGDDTPNCYQDISFMLPRGYSSVNLLQKFYLNGNLGTTTTTALSDTDGGLYRVPLSEANCDYERVDISLTVDDELIIHDYNTMSEEATGDVDWFESVFPNNEPQVTLSAGQSSEKIGTAFTFYPTRVYSINQQFDVTVTGAGTNTAYIRFYTTFSGGVFSGLIEEFSGVISAGVGDKNITFDFTPSQIANYIVFQIVRTAGAGNLSTVIEQTTIEGDTISETKQFQIDCNCSKQEIRLTWLNNLGGFDYWAFTAKKDDIVEIQEAMTTKKNILPTWPKSYGTDADTIKKQTLRVSNKAYTVRSQFLTEDQLNAISFIESSILVQIINSRNDRRTVILGTDSFIKRKDGDKTHEIAFNISFTDDIPVQTL